MENQLIIRNGVVLICFILLTFFFFIKKQEQKTNWSLFYSLLWLTFSLPIVNYLCVKYNLWLFISETDLSIKIPFDLLFIWIIFWGILPFYIAKGKYTLLTFLVLLWIDILLMPQLEKFGILKLNENWIIGEFILLLIVWLPAYLWATYSYTNKHLNFRAFLQVSTMGLLILIIIPFIVISYTSNNFSFEKIRPYLFQLTFIIVLPSLAAVNDLVKKGKGTPFPYDKTTKLVQTGVYAYCRNPIQWSFTFLFIPLSMYYESYVLLSGTIISIAYTLGVSNPQEYLDMENRFENKWRTYKKSVPNWRFLWKPQNIPIGTLYFKKGCNQCEQVKKWFENRNACNLQIKYEYEFHENKLLQATYTDNNNNHYKSIIAIANGLEHINLFWASLSWFMRLPIIHHVLQAIIDSMDCNKQD
ncbi:MAG: hypothetical protein HRT69_06395 [Flavobacteriaceae bacterium]|nr:hypothetical protein [Flavobacteriaceae bacterium]